MLFSNKKIHDVHIRYYRYFIYIMTRERKYIQDKFAESCKTCGLRTEHIIKATVI